MENLTDEKTLFCDVDSTVNNHWVRAKKFYGTPYFHAREVIMQDEPLPGAKEALWRFKQQGYRICYLTARDFPQAYSITYDWLMYHDFPVDEINVVKNSISKVSFLKGRSVDLFIDDLSGSQKEHGSYRVLYEDTISALESAGINFHVFKGDWSVVEREFL